ncbi:uncharacterized protein [Ptychodera flava]|uniref:uncharacterized protein n=1 Tax=Ptychodera flava TaxID=63121 RepID=UPI00396A2CED
MHTVIKQARERDRFLRETEETRRRERERHENREKSDLPPVFNKRLYSAKSHIVITKEAKKIMERNRQYVMSDEECAMANYSLSNHEFLHMKFIVEGLTFIHKGQQYVAECLAHVLTLEKYDAFQYIEKLPHEDRFSCLYILSGVVEVTYDPKTPSAFNAHDTNVVYPHTTGEYLALVSPEGPDKDLPSPATIYTVEPCEFLRIDRRRFHETIGIMLRRRASIKMQYLNTISVLRTLPEENKRKLLPTMIKQTFPAEKVIVRQNDISKFWFLVVSGRCQLLRQVHVPEVNKDVVFKLGILDEGDFFGEEGVKDDKPSDYSVVAMGVVTCYRIKKLSFEGVAKGPLMAFLREHKRPHISDAFIKDFGYDTSVWEEYKKDEVLATIRRRPASEKVISRTRNSCVKKRPQTTLSLYRREGMEEFIQGYQPRPKSAFHLPKQQRDGALEQSQTSIGKEAVDEDSEDESCPLVVGNRDPAEASVGFLPTARMVFGRINTDLSRVEARDFFNDWARHENMMKVQGRLDLSINPADLKDKQDIRNVQLSTKYRNREESTSSYRTHPTPGNREDAWTTPIHEANIESKKHLFVVKFRMNYLKRQLRVRRELKKKAEEKKEKARQYLEKLKLKEAQNGNQNSDQNEAEADDRDGDDGCQDDKMTKLSNCENPHKPSLERHLQISDHNKESSDSGLESGASTPRKAEGAFEVPTIDHKGPEDTGVDRAFERRQSKEVNRALLKKRSSFRLELGNKLERKDKTSTSVKPTTQQPCRSTTQQPCRSQTFVLPRDTALKKQRPL